MDRELRLGRAEASDEMVFGRAYGTSGRIAPVDARWCKLEVNGICVYKLMSFADASLSSHCNLGLNQQDVSSSFMDLYTQTCSAAQRLFISLARMALQSSW